MSEMTAKGRPKLAMTGGGRGPLSLIGELVGVESFSRLRTYEREAKRVELPQGPSACLEGGEGLLKEEVWPWDHV